MGLITGLLTLPLAPVRGTIWVAEQVLEEAERQHYDPARIRRELEDVEELRRSGEITDEQAERLEDDLVERLMESRRRTTTRKGT
ncbi:gas vesicle protein GvpG [Nocardioides sp. LS1]|uniref:gas vesicle protein GvpG n=1 Tax=Nocardioides sp. LS1 TaxID=1027620 RepID=UPI000F618B7D|nr:gas vesicle protein GvpG [Nocardioides sp. LS1]GCD89270.1 gas vesicle protein [Nocardioides sp. LS1]